MTHLVLIIFGLSLLKQNTMRIRFRNGVFYGTVQKNLFKIPSSLATRICRIEPFRSGFAGHAQRFAQELLPFHNPLPIRFLDPVWRTHDSPEFYSNRAPLQKASCPNLKPKPHSDQVGASPCKQKTPGTEVAGFFLSENRLRFLTKAAHYQ
jgi:hypothetical protein